MRIGWAEVDGEDRVIVDSGEDVIALPPGLSPRELIVSWPDRPSGDPVDPRQLRWRPPVLPDKLICVGTNYSDHVAEMAAAGGPSAPGNPWPFGFLKPPHTALVGHDATVALPGYAEKVDWEAELAIVIGDPAHAAGVDPLAAVFGYTLFNDLSVRDFLPLPHALGLDAITAKGFDGSAPMGPWITLARDVGDPNDLGIRCRVNGTLKQDSSTSRMIFGVAEIVAHFGRVMTLHPGDVIATGTPAGVGIARRPPEMLAGGDMVEVEIDRLGTLRTTLAPAPNVPQLRA